MPRSDATTLIGVLGPLDVRRGETQVDVGGPKPQKLLVVLAHQVGRTVPVDRLVDALWGDDSPEHARAALQVNVSRLRRALGSSVHLRSDQLGYALDPDGVEVDVAEFERLGDQATSQRDRDPEAVLDAADRAMCLWRGTPAAEELDITPCAGQLTALRERRLEIQALSYEALLQLGRHRECCPTIAALADEFPFREDLRALHLLALYRSGRQTEALAAYRATRNLLVEELGIEPGPELRSLQRRILEQADDLELRWSDGEHTATAATTLATDNLRPEPNEFVDRPEVDQVIDALEPGRVVTAVGTGGIGKSRCVAAVARRCRTRGRFPDGVWIVDLAPLPEGSTEVAMSVASAIGLGPQPGASFADRVTGYLRHRHALIVLDNCEHVAASAAAFVDDVLRGAPRTTVLAASRIRLGDSSEVVVTLDRLPDSAALQLLTRRVAEVGAGPFSDEHCVDLCAALDNYPLAIELAAARTRTLAPREIIERLVVQPNLLRSSIAEPASGTSRRHADLDKALDWSIGQLSASARQLLYGTSIFVSDFALESAEAILMHDPNDSSDVVDDLGELVEHHLVSRDHGRARFRVLEPIRQHLHAHQPNWVEQRYVDHFSALTIEAARGIRGPDEAIWWDRLNAERPHVRESLRLTIERADALLLDKVMIELAVTSLVCALDDFGEFAIRALSALELDPIDAQGVAIAAAIHHARHQDWVECHELLDVLRVHVADPLIRAAVDGVASINDPASIGPSSPWIASAEASGDTAMAVHVATQGRHPDVARADRFGNPSMRVYARSFLSAYVIEDKHSDEARRNKQELYRIALTSNNNATIAGGQGFMAIQHCYDGEPRRAAPLAIEMIERFARGRSPFWIWHGVEMVAGMLAMVRIQPYMSEMLWAAVTSSGCLPPARMTRPPGSPVWVASQLSVEAQRQAFLEGSLFDMDAAVSEAKKAAAAMAGA